MNDESSEPEDNEFLPAPRSWFEDVDAPPTTTQEGTTPPLLPSMRSSTIQSTTDNLVDRLPHEVESDDANINYSEGEDEDEKVVVATPSLMSRKNAVGAPMPSPSWHEISSQVLPTAARELLSSSLQRILHTAQISYSKGRWYRKYSDLGNNTGGYFRSSSENLLSVELPAHLPELPPFSCLPWVDRQLVKEWRTYLPDDTPESEEDAFDRARTLVPMPIARPTWQKAEVCAQCRKTFGPTRLRHHCRLCGYSYCQPHSDNTHALPHLGYDPDVPERVCDSCKSLLLEQNLAERVAWRLARIRDLRENQLTPYFETGIDTLEDAAIRLTNAALAMAKSIPLGAQASVAVETVDVLRKHGLNGIYTIMLRQEFLAAADLLRKALGINRKAWPLSVHELSAAIFYALAQHRAMRGMNPEREHVIHSVRLSRRNHRPRGEAVPVIPEEDGVIVPDLLLEKTNSDPMAYTNEEDDIVAHLVSTPEEKRKGEEAAEQQSSQQVRTRGSFTPVCDPVPDHALASLLFYAPLALNFIYATKEVDIQLLAAQQGWKLLYAYLQQETQNKVTDRPGSAVFVHEKQKVACLSIRGTSTIQDVVTDIRQTPIPFPESDPEISQRSSDGDWTTVSRGQGLAVAGMAGAAVNLYREHADCLLQLAKAGYRIRLTGHSLGGSVATLLGVLIRRDLKKDFDEDIPLKVYAYASPACLDARLADFVENFVTTVVLHDDVIPRLTMSSCRGLLKHLLHIRDTWVKDHMSDDIMAITERARNAWAPRWREGFMITKSSSSLKRYCRKQLLYGKGKLLSLTDKFVRELSTGRDEKSNSDGASSSKSMGSSFVDDENSVESSDKEENNPHLLVDYMGGIDHRVEGVVIDGEEFFETEQSLIESEDEEDLEEFSDAFVSSSMAQEKAPSNIGDAYEMTALLGESECVDEVAPEAVVLAETPLPRLFIPGRIVHLYSHRGVFKAAYVPRDFRELRRISLAGNMLSDHRCKNYYEALLEAISVRKAPEHAPRWTAFDEDHTCSCCASRFTWASTSQSKAQEARDKHNCRSCGTLVCDPCSTNRIPLPSIGLTTSTRVCDRCYNDINGILTGISPEMTDSFVEQTNSQDFTEDVPQDKPERKRERRSAVVDEFASRLHDKPLIPKDMY